MNETAFGKLRNLTSIYLIHGEQVLLLFRQGSRVVNNVWVSSAGGHFEENELNDARACCLRELQEELGITEDMLSGLSLRYITLYRNKKDIRQNYYFFAELKEYGEFPSNEGQTKWFPLEEMPALEMAFTSKWVTNHYLAEGRFTDKLYAGLSTEGHMEFIELTEFE
ncbi:MAG: NUDIX domain-containing protein [Anaerotignum sp.]|nr:NUDIX domain-containing protein [Anaerotignum sp.]